MSEEYEDSSEDNMFIEESKSDNEEEMNYYTNS